MVIEEKQKNGAQLFFTSNIENYIIKGELTDEVSPELVELLHMGILVMDESFDMWRRNKAIKK